MIAIVLGERYEGVASDSLSKPVGCVPGRVQKRGFARSEPPSGSAVGGSASSSNVEGRAHVIRDPYVDRMIATVPKSVQKGFVVEIQFLAPVRSVSRWVRPRIHIVDTNRISTHFA